MTNIDRNDNFIAKSIGKVHVIDTTGDGYYEVYTVNIGMSISMIMFILCCFVAILIAIIVIKKRKIKDKIMIKQNSSKVLCNLRAVLNY